MKINRFILMAFLLLLPAASFAFDRSQVTQSDTTLNDFTGRIGVELDFELSRHLSLGIENSLRFKNDFKSFDRNYLTAGLSYKPLTYLKAGVGYTFMSLWHDGKKSTDYKKYWDLRHRVQADVSGILPIGNWKITLRERVLGTFRTLKFDPLEKVSPEFSLRTKISAEYTSRRRPLTPYVSVELSNTLNVPDFIGRNYIDKIRNRLGLKWRLTRRSYLDFFYRFDVGYNMDVNIDYKKDKVTIKGVDVRTEKTYTHIIGITYCFNYH